MFIQKECELVISNLFYYDFKSCYYHILKSINWDLDKIEFHDKKTRNIQLGLLQKNNPSLSNYLLESVTNIIDYYLKTNQINNNDIIVRQKDGVILRKKLKIDNQSMKLDLRKIISKLIISFDRKSFLLIDDKGEIEVKGIPNKPEDTTFYNLFRNLDFNNRRNLLLGLDSIRKHVYNSNNILWFATKEKDQYIVPLINGSKLKLNKTSINMIESDEVDKNLFWNSLIWPFIQSLLIYSHSK